MAALGIWLARIVARSLKAEGLLPIVPAAPAVLGGAFVHQTQASVSILLGILLLPYVGRANPLLWAAILLQVPLWYVDTWLTHPYTAVRFESMLAAATCAYFALATGSLRRRSTMAVAVAVAYLAISFVILHMPHATIRMPETAAVYARELGADRQYSTGAWGVHVRGDETARNSSLLTLASKLPIWAGLVCTILIAFMASRAARTRMGKSAALALLPQETTTGGLYQTDVLPMLRA